MRNKYILCACFLILLSGCSNKTTDGNDNQNEKVDCHLVDETKYNVDQEALSMLSNAMQNFIAFESIEVKEYSAIEYLDDSLSQYSGGFDPSSGFRYLISKNPNMAISETFDDKDPSGYHIYIEDLNVRGFIANINYDMSKKPELKFTSEEFGEFVNPIPFDPNYNKYYDKYLDELYNFDDILEGLSNPNYVAHLEKKGDVYTVLFNDEYINYTKQKQIDEYDYIIENSKDKGFIEFTKSSKEFIQAKENEVIHIDFKISDNMIKEIITTHHVTQPSLDNDFSITDEIYSIISEIKLVVEKFNQNDEIQNEIIEIYEKYK